MFEFQTAPNFRCALFHLRAVRIHPLGGIGSLLRGRAVWTLPRSVSVPLVLGVCAGINCSSPVLTRKAWGAFKTCPKYSPCLCSRSPCLHSGVLPLVRASTICSTVKHRHTKPYLLTHPKVEIAILIVGIAFINT